MTIIRRVLAFGAALSGLACVAAESGSSSASGAESQGADVLSPMKVTAPAYRSPLTPLEKSKLDLYFGLRVGLLDFLLDGSTVLTPERVAQASRNVIYSTTVLPQADKRSTSLLGIEHGFNALPECLFNDERAMRQDVTGREGVFRSDVRSALVLIDGIPFDNAWDGTIAWGTIPRESLSRVEIVPGGAAVPWADGVAGVIQYFRIPAMGKLEQIPLSIEQQKSEYPPPPKQVVVSTGRVFAGIGSEGTEVAEFAFSQPTETGVLQILGRGYTTDGFDRLERQRRGQIDTPAAAHQGWLEMRWRQLLGKRGEVTAALRRTGEFQNLGTRAQEEHSDETQVSLTFAGSNADGFKWTGVLYGENERGRRTFSVADPSRTVETALINEYARPTQAWGASWTGSWPHEGNNRTNVGADLRLVRGESRSELDFQNGVFLSDVKVGGAQDTIGVFILHHQQLTASSQATIGARFDHWMVTDGFRRTTEQGLPIEEISFPRRDAFEFTPTAGWVTKLSAHWRMQASVQSGFRQPTLSQRFSLRGQDAFIFEPESALPVERRTRGELNLEYFGGERIRVRASVFAEERRDAIGSQALVAANASFALATTLPAGYEVRRWISLDRARIHGAQLSLGWTARKTVRFDADLVVSHSQMDRVSAARNLEGKELAGVSHFVGHATATWQVTPETSLHARMRGASGSYANEENTLRLRSWMVADVGFNRKLNARTEAFLWIENVGDVRVQTMRGPADLVYLDSPRTILTGVRVIW